MLTVIIIGFQAVPGRHARRLACPRGRYAYINMHVYVHTDTYLYALILVYTFICVYIYMYMYTHIARSRLACFILETRLEGERFFFAGNESTYLFCIQSLHVQWSVCRTYGGSEAVVPSDCV